MAPLFEIVYLEAAAERVVAVSGEVVLGRSADCDVVLPDLEVSRHHAKLVIGGSRCRIVDLGSEGGTRVNGVPVNDASLKDGDRIHLGRFSLSFRRRLDDAIILDAERPFLPEETVVRGVDQLRDYLVLHEAGRAHPGPREPIEPTNRILRSLSDLARTLLSTQPDEVPRRVMDALFEHIPAERGFLMLFDREGVLRPRVVKHRRPAGARETISVSKTIADRVVSDRVAILTSDAQVDPRFSVAESVQSFNIRSAMCAPLWKDEKVIGIVHVDTPVRAEAFTVTDLDLLTALSNYAAIAIEQANLNETVREQRYARVRLEKYFSPKVVTRILSEGEREVDEIDATVLFADIVGFARLAEKMSPRSVSELLNRYFSTMTDAIHEYDGTLDKFIGDCIMAVFGAPYPQPDHAVRAVSVALEMRQRLAALNRARWPEPPIELRMGINSGRVVAGPMGSSRRKEFTVLGDTVNIASRIESTVAKAGLIIVGQRTRELVKDCFTLRDLGSVSFPGKDEKLNVYEVLGEGERPGQYGDVSMRGGH